MITDQQILEREIFYASKTANKLRKIQVPNFSFGTNHLVSEKQANDADSLIKFVQDWKDNPHKFLDFNNFLKQPVSLKNQWLEFNDIVWHHDRARFYCNFQPRWRSGSKIGVIVIPHWNGSPNKYIRGTAWIRRIFLPVNTAIYLPTHKDDSEYLGAAQYNVLGPNLGLTIRKVQQDVLNVQYCAEYLRHELGCEEIGIWSYSIGSLRGFLSAMFAPKLFDFLLFHLMCDSFAEAVLSGVSTKEVSDVLNKNISREKLEHIWSIISPGHYTSYMSNLPGVVRVVQGKHDYVLGPENVERMNEKFLRFAPSAELYRGDFGHLTLGDVTKTLPVLLGNVRFIYRSSSLQYL